MINAAVDAIKVCLGVIGNFNIIVIQQIRSEFILQVLVLELVIYFNRN